MWQVEVSWVLAVPHWEVGSWCRETVELRPGNPRGGGEPIVRWRSDPWCLNPVGSPEDGVYHHIVRQVPSQLAGPTELDVDADSYALEVIRLDAPLLGAVVRLAHEQQIDRLHAVVRVEPVAPEADMKETRVVTGQFGATP